MKNIFSSIVIFITTFLTMSNYAIAVSIDGVWLNSDFETKGITKILISESQPGELHITPFGKCYPKDCEWGLMNAQISNLNGPIHVSYINEYKSVELLINMYNDYSLEVMEKRVYHSKPDQIHEVFYLMIRKTNPDE